MLVNIDETTALKMNRSTYVIKDFKGLLNDAKSLFYFCMNEQ